MEIYNLNYAFAEKKANKTFYLSFNKLVEACWGDCDSVLPHIKVSLDKTQNPEHTGR